MIEMLFKLCLISTCFSHQFQYILR